MSTAATEQTPAPEGHDQKMIERFEQSQQTTQQTPTDPAASKPERPAHIPEKFWDADKGEVRIEDLAKSYSELEKGREKPADKPKEETPPGLKIETPQEAQQTLQDKGLDLQKFTDEFLEKGALSDESYKSLTDKGIPKEMVDAYIEGQVAKAEAFEIEVKTLVGGSDKFAEMSKWASTNLTKGELAAYNAAVDSGNADQIKLAVSGINAKFTAAVGSEPTLLNGNTTGASGDVFKDNSELVTAMKDPRYKTSEAYRQEVQAKLGRSKIL